MGPQILETLNMSSEPTKMSTFLRSVGTIAAGLFGFHNHPQRVHTMHLYYAQVLLVQCFSSGHWGLGTWLTSSLTSTHCLSLLHTHTHYCVHTTPHRALVRNLDTPRYKIIKPLSTKKRCVMCLCPSHCTITLSTPINLSTLTMPQLVAFRICCRGASI